MEYIIKELKTKIKCTFAAIASLIDKNKKEEDIYTYELGAIRDRLLEIETSIDSLNIRIERIKKKDKAIMDIIKIIAENGD